MSLATGATVSVDIHLAKSARIEGQTLNDATGAILGNVTVEAYDADGVLVKSTTSSTSNGAFVLDNLASGTYYLKFSASGYSTEWYNGKTALDSADSIVVTAPAAVTDIVVRMKQPDLVVSSITVPDFVGYGQTLEISWTILNQGTGTASADYSWRWYDHLYLSNDGTTLNTFITSVNAPTALAPGETYTLTQTITVPTNLGTGAKYFVVVADYGNGVAESNENNNRRSKAVTIGAADLIMGGIVAPTNAAGGQTIDLSWTVTNQGTDATTASGWYDRVYLSSDTNVSSDYVLLVNHWTGESTPLAAGAAYTVNRTVTLPTTVAGNQYFIFVTDHFNNQPETNSLNNKVTQAIALNAPDLVLTTASAPASAVLGETVTLSWTVDNAGAHPAPANWYDRVYLSIDNSLDTIQDVLIYNYYAGAHSPLAAGEGYTVSVDVKLPEFAATGTAYLIFVTDGSGAQGETKTSNNTFVRSITLSAPDLTVT
ncbi:CARDB domain-containing protein, partial [Limnospira sp. PMC 1254.20]|uniref:CARDB domain-containing protein n=2 Tax=unclassified Limnospira TaxID=2642885 RepID=UPI0028EF998B